MAISSKISSPFILNNHSSSPKDNLKYLGQGFSTRALGPLGSHGVVLWGPQAEAFTE